MAVENTNDFPYRKFYNLTKDEEDLEILKKSLCWGSNIHESCCSCRDTCIDFKNCCIDKFWNTTDTMLTLEVYLRNFQDKMNKQIDQGYSCHQLVDSKFFSSNTESLNYYMIDKCKFDKDHIDTKSVSYTHLTLPTICSV